MNEISFTKPFESRKAAQDLRNQIIQFLIQSDLKPGEPFYSDADLVKHSGLSRKTVRDALSNVQKEGWIERRQGKGSFVGPRAGMALPPLQPPPSNRKSLIRLAVLGFWMSGDRADWYSSEVLRGLEEVSADCGVSIELIGDHHQKPGLLHQRLMQSRPDLLLVMPSTMQHAYAVAEARHLGIPCAVTGTRLQELKLPSAAEDNHQGMALAVQHLFDLGHRRIALLQREESTPFTFERRRGYLDALSTWGIEPDERLVWWTSDGANDLKSFLKSQKPTAVICSNLMLASPIGQLIKHEGLRIPQDLSLVTFDQSYATYEKEFGLRPTVIELPLVEMGKTIMGLAREILNSQNPHQNVRIPCRLSIGGSTAPLSHS
ncbi:GntR family transcriptional regulator [Kiritimatiellaeota bacterium B1221]|nr:GntR family transcriptional regulator [Kiritimatiellaeota bacterium B1221]